MRIKSFIAKLITVLILSLTLMIPFVIQPAQASVDYWTTKAPMLTARTLLEVAVVNDKIMPLAATPTALTLPKNTTQQQTHGQPKQPCPPQDLALQ